MAKLALLFSGQVRKIDPWMFNKSLKIFIGKHDADVYMSHWDTSGKSGHHDPSILLGNTSTDLDIISQLNIAFTDIKVKKHKVISNQHWEMSCSDEVRRIIENKKYSILTINSAKQLFQIHESYSLIDNPACYDFIVRCRFDSVFLFEFQVPEVESRNIVWNINFGNAYYKNRIYDIFFFTAPLYSSAVFSLPWLRFGESVRDDFDNRLDRRDACRILYLNAKAKNLDVMSTSIRYCDIYRNNRKYFFDIFWWGLSGRRNFNFKLLKKYFHNVYTICHNGESAIGL